MSAVTAAILVGFTPRLQDGINPRWIALLHEGQSYAWQLLHLQLSPSEVYDSTRDDPPGVLWRASEFEDLAGELSLLLHLYATRTPEVVQLAKRIRHIQRRRVDLAGLAGAEKADFQNLLRIAKERGRELRLAAHIYPGSRLTDEHLLSMPDWELEVGYTAFSRDWVKAGGGQLVIRERGITTDGGADPSDSAEEEDEAEFAGERAAFIADLPGEQPEPQVDAYARLAEALRNSDMSIVDDEPTTGVQSARPADSGGPEGPSGQSVESDQAAGVEPIGEAADEVAERHVEPTTGSEDHRPLRSVRAVRTDAREQSDDDGAAPAAPTEHRLDMPVGPSRSTDTSGEALGGQRLRDVHTRAIARTIEEQQRGAAEVAELLRASGERRAVPVTGREAESPWGDRGEGTSEAAYATLFGDVNAWLERDGAVEASKDEQDATRDARRPRFGRRWLRD